MYAKSTRPSAKRKVHIERSAKRDDQIARPRRPKNLRMKRAARDEIFIVVILNFRINNLNRSKNI